MPCHSVRRKTQTQLSGYISVCDTNRDVCLYTTTTRPSRRPYRQTYEAKRIAREAGIATSEFKLSLRVAALCVLLVCLAVLALPLEVAEVGVEALRVELTTAEVVGIEAFAAPDWTWKYMPWKRIRENKVKISKLYSCKLGRRTHRDGLAKLARLLKGSGRMLESIKGPKRIIMSSVRRTDM